MSDTNVLHVSTFLQSMITDKFQMFDFGPEGNKKKYNQVRYIVWSFTKIRSMLHKSN